MGDTAVGGQLHLGLPGRELVSRLLNHFWLLPKETLSCQASLSKVTPTARWVPKCPAGVASPWTPLWVPGHPHSIAGCPSTPCNRPTVRRGEDCS